MHRPPHGPGRSAASTESLLGEPPPSGSDSVGRAGRAGPGWAGPGRAGRAGLAGLPAGHPPPKEESNLIEKSNVFTKRSDIDREIWF